MFTFEVTQGVVSNKQDMRRVSGRMHKGTGHVKTKHTTVCNIGGQATQLNGTGGMYFFDEDELIAVGQKDNTGVLHIFGFKNLSTGVVKKSSIFVPLVMALCMIFIGVWTYFLVIPPIIFIPLGLLGLWGVFKNIKANQFLMSVIPDSAGAVVNQ